MEYSPRRGFTLLELLIVITILAILTLVVILFINPVEILKKSRDVQRMSDLRTMKTAIALYLQDKSSNNLGGTATCGSTYPVVEPVALGTVRTTIATATPGTGLAMLNNGVTAGCATSGAPLYNGTTTTDMFKNNGQGWIPYIDFSTFTGGAPIEKLPVDPINTSNSGSAGAGTCAVDSLYYRYGCRASNNTFSHGVFVLRKKDGIIASSLII
ncbi:prepilin-type N-terminal cleavage/methylation domain-containing protein [Candidatus Azambacteria bacterium]|nr:prepilin-type N-terminal cleavage/methylation domain-containing protein [Candidatus Azambacteria bacterium]